MEIAPIPTSRPAVEYRILVKGILGKEWAEWFDGMAIRFDEKGNTILCGHVSDQAALHGLLDRVRDLGLTLLSVTRSNP